ncbi:MAG: 3-oxoacyl-[acyl-carrier-protein] reductase [Butyrivibrio sp.]|nr:3-oxoacyl-[acyl-carrier-protein] reductase [Butyrivibrio sp.]
MEDRQCAIITGAGRGIGRAIAVKLYENGMNVVINYANNDEAARETERLCKDTGAGGEVLVVKGDVSNPDDAGNIVDEAVSKFGRVDVLVNNAGITRDGLLLRMSEEDFDRVLDTNLKGAFFLTKEVVKPMMKKRYGRIINISSIVGVHGNAGQANYAASKAGLIGLTKSVAKELAGRNITSNAVAPGMIRTEMTDVMDEKVKDKMKSEIPLGRMGTPEDIADAVAFLADEKSSYITGQVLVVDGGLAL